MKCEGAETLLRAVIDNDEGVVGAIRRERWLAGQSPEYLQELADSAQILAIITGRCLASKRVTVT